MADADVGTPKWWLNRLTRQLAKRSKDLWVYDRWYTGEHRLAFASEKFKTAFGGLFGKFADNWCEVVVDAVEERLNPVGFRFGDSPEADKDAWDFWQRNELDADSQLCHIDNLSMGYGYTLVWGDEDGEPLITVESPLEAIVAHASGSRRNRAAGLKQWRGDDGYLYACLYLPDDLYKFRSQSKNSEIAPDIDSGGVVWVPWQPDTDDTWPLENTLGTVPLVPFYNQPRTSKPGLGRSEIDGVIPVQKAINKLCVDLLVASEFGSFRQRWASGLELDKDEHGNPINPFKNFPGAIWAAESGDDTSDVKFGDFGETDLANIVGAVEMFVQHVASQSRTPPHYLNASADRLSGESIKAAETGLVAKTRRKMRHLGESWEETERLAFAVKGDPRAHEAQAETVWADPESRTESEHVDATMKKRGLVPDQQLLEDLGYSPQTIARFAAMRAQDVLLGLVAAPAAPAAPVGVPQVEPVETA